MRRADKEKAPDDLRALQQSIAEALKQTRLAYQFCPGSYTHSALNACLSAVKRLSAVRNQTTITKPLAAAPPSGSNSNAVRVARRRTPTEQGCRPRPAGTKAGPKAQAAAGNSRKKKPGKCDP
jgi:hypothetical protein